MRIQFSETDHTRIYSGSGIGLEVGVKGFRGDPSASEDHPSQVFIEIHNGKLRVHVWNGDSEDPQTIEINPAQAEPQPQPQPVPKKRTKLAEPLRTLLLMGVKQSGTYDPDSALSYVEEQLTFGDMEQVTPFLKWCHANKKTFGDGNLDQRYAEYLKQRA